MKISEAIKQLEDIKSKFGDIAITGGCMCDDVPLHGISVTDVNGMEVYPRDPNGVAGKHEIDGVFLE